MADIGSLITIADKLLNLLQCPLLNEMSDYKAELKKLNDRVTFIKNMFLDADKKIDLSHAERAWIERLKDALYDADDLFDEYLTIVQKKQLNKDANLSKKVSKKVCDFFSSKNPLILSYHTSQEVKNIRQKLDAIASDHDKFRFKVDSKATRKRREETCAYIHAPSVIGRDYDLKEVVSRLTCDEDTVSFITIVGVGGLGKTALAQLVSNDEKVQKEFPLRLWACVSDQDGEQFDVKAILCKVLESATGHKPEKDLSLDSIRNKLHRELERKKYLLILDDVWNEDHLKWVELSNFLKVGDVGRRIVVTTRSKETARVIQDSCVYELHGLSPQYSWKLFEMTALDNSHREHSPELVEIGKKIVKKCSNVPLAIKVVGSLLYGQGIDKWRSFEKSGLAGIGNGDNQIMSILKFSYYNLEPSLKSCFTYCALFPKDFEIEKQMLIELWMSQGYVVPLDRCQSIEDGSEEHFSILLRRCFFQDVKTDHYGSVKSFKIHDLMHDVAQEVARDEFCVLNFDTKSPQDKNRHLFHAGWKYTEGFSKMKLRSCIHFKVDSLQVDTLVANWTCLRALGLQGLGSKKLPDSIGKLLHLRYLNLSNNRRLETLPNSIAELYNLQTLNLRCSGLKEWPKRFGKLVNLRHLYIDGCDCLKYMPSGMEKLTHLQVLTDFIVSDESSSKSQRVGQLKELQALSKLEHRLDIRVSSNFVSGNGNDQEGGYCLEGTERLKGVRIFFPPSYVVDVLSEEATLNYEALMAKLRPHGNVMEFELWNYAGVKIPRWGKAEDNWATFFPNLIWLDLSYCHHLKELPVLSKLQSLEFLRLFRLSNLEYMEDISSSILFSAASGSESREVDFTFFPSLRTLEFWYLDELKGWWREEDLIDRSCSGSTHQHPTFPCLRKLEIHGCPNLTSFPPCPILEGLTLTGNSEVFRVTMHDQLPASSSFASCSDHLCLDVYTDSLDYLKSVPAGHITSIRIYDDKRLQSISEVEDVLKSCSSSLKSLEISSCFKLRDLSGGLEHLTALESLRLYLLPEIVTLPEGIQHLTNLKHFNIEHCENLEALPECISCLQSLQSLIVFGCPALRPHPVATQ